MTEAQPPRWALLALGSADLCAGVAGLVMGGLDLTSGVDAAGGILVLLYVLALDLDVLLLVAGVGVLKTKPYGRLLGELYCPGKILLHLAIVAILGNASAYLIMGLVYAPLRFVLLQRPAWKTLLRTYQPR